MARPKRLTPLPPNARQQRFIDAYLRTNDAPASAIAAGYSASQAKKNAGRLLRTPSIAHVLRAELDARAERTRIAADRIIQELARVAFSDPGRIVAWSEDKGWQMRPLDELSDADRAAIARLRVRDGDVAVVLHDKIRALDALGKYFKLWGRHAEKFGPRRPGEGAGEAANGDYSNEQQARARAAFAARLKARLAEHDAEHRAKLAEEEDWARAWRETFG